MKLADRSNYLFMLRLCWRLSDLRARKMFIIFFAMSIISNLISLIEPLILARIIEAITRGGDALLSKLVFWLLMWLLTLIAFWCFHGPSRVIERRFSFSVRTALTRFLYNRVSSLPWSWHQQNHSGSVINRINSATQSVYEFAEQQFIYIQLFITIVGSISVLLWIAPTAGLVMTISLPILSIIFQRFDKSISETDLAWTKAEQNTAAGLSDYLGNIATVLTLRLQAASSSEIMRRLGLIKIPLVKSIYLNEGKWCSYGVLLRTIQVVALIGFIWSSRHADPVMMAGTAVAMLQYMRSINTTFFQAATLFQSLIRSRINVDAAEFISDAVRQREIAKIEDWHSARIDDLVFSYEDREQHAHHLNVSLELQRGRRIALVGTSGSGKSTLLRLLRGLHDGDGGTLTVDGTVYQGIAPLADLSTLVPQDPEIFENTIRYNITCGIAEDETALNAAIHAAALESVIAELPQGIETDIRERGVNLSGGQKQRLALARGILAARDSSLILLDEPTSSLDAATESLVFDRLFETHRNACIVASLHRLHLLERFDYVYVMEAGRVVEQGDFATLVAAGGVLSRLWKAQQAERE